MSNNKKRYISILIIVVLSLQVLGCHNKVVSSPVTDPEPQPVQNPSHSFISASLQNTFKEYDRDHSGYIELNELAGAPDSFREMDKNKDQKLSIEEIQPSQERLNQMRELINNFYKDLYKHLDQNQDNRVSSQEVYTNEILEPIKNSFSWKKSTAQVSSLSINSSTNTVSEQEFSQAMNNFFLDLASESAVQSTGLWSWLKKKLGFGSEEPVAAKPRPIILVQGYAEPSWYFLYGIYRNLKKHGYKVYPINLFPNIGDIREQARLVAAKVEEIKRIENVEKIDYVCHSMGGLIGRYYIQDLGGIQNIERFVSIATPHYGTQMAWLGIGRASKQMRPNSDFLIRLNQGNPIRTPIRYTSIWTSTDEIVVPADSARLAGSDIKEKVRFVGHLLILWAPKTYSQIREALQ